MFLFPPSGFILEALLCWMDMPYCVIIAVVGTVGFCCFFLFTVNIPSVHVCFGGKN